MGKAYGDIQNLSSEYIDPLHGTYKIDEPFASGLNHPAMQSQVKRLEKIRSLGLIFRFFPAGNHTKWEHYLGMYNVAKNIKYGLNKPKHEELQWLCLLRGFGHLPCTYVTASAVFLAIALSREFNKRLHNLLRPISRICRGCEEQEYCSGRPAVAVFKNHDYKALRAALSACKLVQLPEEVDIGHRYSLVRGCICPRDKLYRLCDAISRYDYMQRDLYHTGLAKFSMSYDEAFKTLNDGIDALEMSPPMRLLDELYDYLVDSLYLRPDVACYESVLAKLLADKLCTGEIDLNELIKYDDISLMDNLEKTVSTSPMAHAGKSSRIFDFRPVDISTDWLESLNPTALEMKLLGIKSNQKGKLLTYPEEDGVILSVHHMWDGPEGTSTFRVILNVLQGNNKIHPIVSTAFRLRAKFLGEKLEDSLKLAEQILSYAFGRKRIVHDNSRVQDALSRMIDAISEVKANTIVWETYDIFSKYVTREDFPLAATRFWRMLQHPARQRTRSLAGEELRKLWDRMVTSLVSLASNPNVFSESWKPILRELRDLVHRDTNGGGEIYEALVYLIELVSTRKGRPKAVLPSVKFVTNNGNLNSKGKVPENEVDVISIELWPKNVTVKLIECTKSTSAAKATDDYRKLEDLKGIFDSRHFSDLHVSIEVIGSSEAGKGFVSIDQLLKARF